MNASDSTRPPQSMPEAKYVLLTAAHNEEANIARTVESIISQTILPQKWVIVSDNSTDGTDEILRTYASQHRWIHVHRVSRKPGASFACKVLALQEGAQFLDPIPSNFIGNFDGDVTVEPFYYQTLIERFNANPTLGIAGGFVHDQYGGEFRSRKNNSVHSVAHAGQLVRRECYDAIGGYAVLKYGGEDWHAQISAKMKGWDAQSFPELKIFHYRPTGTMGSPVKYAFRQGRMDYTLGSYPPFEIIKCLKRMTQKPPVVAAVARLLGFAWSTLLREKRPVTTEFITFLQNEQKERVRSLFQPKKAGPESFSEAAAQNADKRLGSSR